MFSKIKLLLATALAAGSFMVPVIVPHVVNAAASGCLDNTNSSINDNLNCGACLSTSDNCSTAPDPGSHIDD